MSWTATLNCIAVMAGGGMNAGTPISTRPEAATSTTAAMTSLPISSRSRPAPPGPGLPVHLVFQQIEHASHNSPGLVRAEVVHLGNPDSKALTVGQRVEKLSGLGVDRGHLVPADERPPHQ